MQTTQTATATERATATATATTNAELLAIERNFLNLPDVKAKLRISEVKSLKRSIDAHEVKSFNTSLCMASIVGEAYAWYQSEEGKNTMASEGITWTTEEFSLKVFGFQKSNFHKLVRASKVEPSKVEEYRSKVEELKQAGKKAAYSIAELLKFAKGEGIAAGAGDGDGEEAGAEEVTTILTLSYKRDGGNVAVRMDSAGNIKTTNSAQEIAEAIATLTQALQTLQA